MRIAEDRPRQVDGAHAQGIQGRKGARETNAPFDSLLRDRGQADSRAALNRLLEQITEQGEVIARRRDIYEVRKYREMVADFLEEAMRSAYQANRERSFDSRGRMREYSTVQKINGELEHLARDVLDEQKDNLAILQDLGTIKGLLLDLLV